MASGDEAVAALEKVGLTEYESKCFVALSRVPKATAKELSQLAEVPRPRVYDTVDRLRRRGLVDIQQSDPREFRAISRDEAVARLRQDYTADLREADEALAQVESVTNPEEKGVWAIANADQVDARVTALLDEAEESVHLLVTNKDILGENTLERLATADDRGVSILVEVPSESIRDHVTSVVPEATVVIADDLGETQKVVKKWPGQLLLIDHRAVLATGVEETHLPGVTKETAVWSHGHDHGIAAWLRELLQDRAARTSGPE